MSEVTYLIKPTREGILIKGNSSEYENNEFKEELESEGETGLIIICFDELDSYIERWLNGKYHNVE